MSLLKKNKNLESDEMFDEEYEKFKSKNLYKNVDGTLNKKAIALTGIGAILFLAIFGMLGHQLISSNDNPIKGYLESEEGRDAVENAFFEALEQYTNGEITADEFKSVLTKLISDYIKTNGMFTDEQKAELEKYIADYIASAKLEELISMNQTHINNLTKELSKYEKENTTTLQLLRETLQKEIDNNAIYTQEQLDILNDLYEKLENLELKHFENIEKYIQESNEKFDHITNDITYNMQNGLSFWEANKEYEINTFVLYVVDSGYHQTGTSSDLDIPGYSTKDVHMFQNLTGVNTATNPMSDKTNWKEVSLGQAIQNIYNVTLSDSDNDGDVMSFEEWLKNHKENADGTVIDQYVTYNNYVYQNITGEYDPSKTPDQDTTNWEKLSLLEAIQKNLQTMLDDLYKSIKTYNAWLEDHETNAGGDVINQYVTYENKLYQNITGEYDPSKTPDQDTTNWKQVSVTEAITNVYNTYLTGLYGDTAGWQEGVTYKIDDYVIYKNKIYRNITGEQTGANPAEDTENWREASAFGEINNNYQTFLQRLYGGILEWDPTTSYKPNSYVMYKNQLYRNLNGVNTDVSPDLDTANWTATSMITVIQNTYNTFLSVTGASDYEPGATYSDGDYVIYNNTIYKNVTNNAETKGGAAIPGVTEGDGTKSVWIPVLLTDMIDQNYQTFINVVGAEDYNSNHSYQADNYVIYNDTLYRATDATSGPFDSSKWEPVTVTSQLETLASDLEQLELKTSLNLEMVNQNLIDMINDNKSLTDEQREEMLKKIEENEDSSMDGLQNLYQQLIEIINSNESENSIEREKILNQLDALNDNTAAYMDDYEKRIKDLEDRTTSLDGQHKMQFDYQNGSYGFSIDGTYRPF